MQHEERLLLLMLDRHEPHAGPLHRLAASLGVGGIVLVALDVRLHISRWHQVHLVAQRDQFPRPVMRCRTGLHANQARRPVAEVVKNLPASQATPRPAEMTFAPGDHVIMSFPWCGTCPNCRLPIKFPNSEVPPCGSGDRVLVAPPRLHALVRRLDWLRRAGIVGQWHSWTSSARWTKGSAGVAFCAAGCVSRL